MIPAGGALAAIGFVALHRSRPPAIDDVEWALLTKKPKQAKRWAKRILRKNPTELGAVFLYGTALAALKQYQNALDELEPLAAKMKPKDRAGVDARDGWARLVKAGERRSVRSPPPGEVPNPSSWLGYGNIRSSLGRGLRTILLG